MISCLIFKFLARAACAACLLASMLHAANYEQSVSFGMLEILGMKMSATIAGPAAPATSLKTDRRYVDGYNFVDSSGNLGEGASGLLSRTAFFGYANGSQVDLKSGVLNLHDVRAPSGPYIERPASAGRPDFEIAYRIVRANPGAPRIGVEARLGHFAFRYAGSENLPVSMILLTDAYQLGGVVPPPAPYSGAFTVIPFTPRIGDIPSRSLSAVQGVSQGRREFSLSGPIARLGGIWRGLDFAFGVVELHGGPAILALRGSFAATENLSTGDFLPLAVTGSGVRSKTVLAPYAGISARLRIGNAWSVAAGADWLDAGHFTVSSSAGNVRFDLTQALLVNLDLVHRF